MVSFWEERSGQTAVNGQVLDLVTTENLVGPAVSRELIEWATGKGWTDTGRILKAARRRAAGELAPAGASVPSDAEGAWKIVARYAGRKTPPPFDDARIREITDRMWPITKEQFLEAWK